MAVEPGELERRRAEKAERQNKNLHGGERVDGLTGRWRGVFYERGIARPRRPLEAPITPLAMYRERATRRAYSD